MRGTITSGERAALNRHYAEICKILGIIWSSGQLRLNINERSVQSWEQKMRVQVLVKDLDNSVEGAQH